MIGLYWLPERRCLMEKELVKRYHKDLSNFGVKNYSWDEFFGMIIDLVHY